MKNTNYTELKDACKILGLEFTEFIDSPEIEKGIGSTNYKELYYQQLEANQKLISAIGNSYGSINTNFEELKKGVVYLQENLSEMRTSPLHKQKSYTGGVHIVEKAFGGEEGKVNYNGTYSITKQNKQLKGYLGQKMMVELSKGVQNGTFEKAALQLDANGFIENSLIQKILEIDKILITE